MIWMVATLQQGEHRYHQQKWSVICARFGGNVPGNRVCVAISVVR
jgi:hypothetical protein